MSILKCNIFYLRVLNFFKIRLHVMSYNTALLVTDADITKSSRSPEDQKPTAAGLKLTLNWAWFCSRQCPKQNEIIQKKKSQRYTEDCLFEFWRSLATARDAPVIWWERNLAIFFAQNIFHICLRVLWGIACICMINIRMADNQHVITDCSQISVWMQSI